jgi:subtilisin family serine protease
MADSLRKTDPYLQNAFASAVQENELLGGGFLGFETGGDAASLPMLVRLRDPDRWQPPSGFEIQSRIGSIISGRGTLAVLAALDEDSGVLSVEASRPAGTLECATSVPFVKATAVHAPAVGEEGDAAIVAIIDAGIDPLHQAFRDATGASRIVEIWDQRDSAGPPPNALYPNLGLSYGTVHDAARIAGWVAAGAAPASLGSTAWPLDGIRHGTHVTSIAAGRATGTFAGGVAPAARIVVVLPRLGTSPGDPTSIGYSSSHAEALTYIKEVAHQRGMPVAVNVSLGMNAGAHDGTSLLEAAFDGFSQGGREPGLVIVKSAGNERGHDGHAKLVVAADSADTLTWSADATISRKEDLFELWFQASDELRFVLKDPAGNATPQVSWTNPAASGAFPSGNGYLLSYTRYHQDNGDSRLLVVVRPGTAGQIRGGTWTLEIETGRVPSAGEVHAWVERFDLRPVRFTNNLDQDSTLSIPATAQTVITVGAVNSAFPTRTTTSSSYGLTRDGRSKPDLVAPGTDVIAARAGTGTGTMPMTGTSMAAPHVTGAIALLLSHHAKQPNGRLPNAAQIQAAITQLSQRYNGHHTPGHGFGVLDAEALFHAFD